MTMTAVETTAEMPIINGFIPATGALTKAILVSVCKDVAKLGNFPFREVCKGLNETIAYHYIGWQWERGA